MYQNFVRNPYENNNRFFPFFVPFLAGGLAGSAIVGLTRPRPIYVNQMPYPRPYYPYPYY